MLTTMARLLDAFALRPRQPDPGLPHPAAQRLSRHAHIMALGQLLGRQRRAKVRVVLPDQRDGVITHHIRKAVVRRPTTSPVRNRRRTASAVSLQQPMGLPLGDHASDRPPPRSSADGHRAAPVHQSDSALACSSAPHPSDPQPPHLSTKRKKTDIPTLLSADILALRPQGRFADPMLWNNYDRAEPRLRAPYPRRSAFR